MLVTSTCLNNLLNPYVLLQQKFENFGRIDSKSAFKKNIYLESLNFEKFFLWYLELFLRISAKTFRRFYVGASRANRQRHFKTSSTGDENAFNPPPNLHTCISLLKSLNLDSAWVRDPCPCRLSFLLQVLARLAIRHTCVLRAGIPTNAYVTF